MSWCSQQVNFAIIYEINNNIQKIIITPNPKMKLTRLCGEVEFASSKTSSSPAAMTGGCNHPVHILLIPLMAPGHMIPMLDLARLLASRGVLITFCTTPVNLARIRPIVDQAVVSSLPIHFLALHFPVADAGLPEGCENTDLLPSPDFMFQFLNALPLLRHSLLNHIRDPVPSHWPPPSGLISDFLHHWTADIARSLDVPRLIFHGTSCFFLLCSLYLDRQKPDLEAAMAASCGPIVLQGLPQQILLRKHQIVSSWSSGPDWSKFMVAVREAEKLADGVLVNSFADLEQWYLKRYEEEMGMPIFPIGPLSLYKEEADAKENRGRVSSADNKLLFRWLDEQKAGSVVLVCFGSTARNSKAQIVELGYGLEASGSPFIWVLQTTTTTTLGISDDDEWVVELEKRVEGRGILVRGWAPQVVILGHPAVGGFVTHCGWNSTLEAVVAGVVMVTWPHFWDQFFNERLVVDVLKIGVAVGVEEPTVPEDVQGGGSVAKVRREDVKMAVERLMDGGEEGRERRERAKELSVMAGRAMEEGGSSWQGFQDLIAYILLQSRKKMITD